MLNDNRQRQLAAALFALYGLPDQANRCPCGSHAPFVDGHNLNGKRGPLYVWCADCGRSGPERLTYNDALAAWNRATASGDLSEITLANPPQRPG